MGNTEITGDAEQTPNYSNKCNTNKKKRVTQKAFNQER